VSRRQPEVFRNEIVVVNGCGTILPVLSDALALEATALNIDRASNVSFKLRDAKVYGNALPVHIVSLDSGQQHATNGKHRIVVLDFRHNLIRLNDGGHRILIDGAGDDYLARSRKRIDYNDILRGRAVHDTVIILALYFLQLRHQLKLLRRDGVQTDSCLSGLKRAVRRHNMNAVHTGLKDMVMGVLVLVSKDSRDPRQATVIGTTMEAVRKVSAGVQVNKQDFLPIGFSKDGGHISGGCGFCHTAFLIHNRNLFNWRSLPFSVLYLDYSTLPFSCQYKSFTI